MKKSWSQRASQGSRKHKLKSLAVTELKYANTSAHACVLEVKEQFQMPCLLPCAHTCLHFRCTLTLIKMFALLFVPLTVPSPLLDNPGDSSFWTVSPAVSRLEYGISRIIAEGCHFFSRLDSVLTIKFQIFYVV